MRVLVACEYSGRVRNAFRSLGHEAWSCDLLDSEDESTHHIKGDCLEVIRDGWDLMVAHPPCTHLAVSGSRWFPEKVASGEQKEAIEFFLALARSPISRIAIENPICIMSSVWRQPDQVVHPWQFGHGETKATCFWLKGLPPLFQQRLSKGESQEFITCRQGQTDGKSGAGPTRELPRQWHLNGGITQIW